MAFISIPSLAGMQPEHFGRLGRQPRTALLAAAAGAQRFADGDQAPPHPGSHLRHTIPPGQLTAGPQAALAGLLEPPAKLGPAERSFVKTIPKHFSASQGIP